MHVVEAYFILLFNVYFHPVSHKRQIELMFTVIASDRGVHHVVFFFKKLYRVRDTFISIHISTYNTCHIPFFARLNVYTYFVNPF